MISLRISSILCLGGMRSMSDENRTYMSGKVMCVSCCKKKDILNVYDRYIDDTTSKIFKEVYKKDLILSTILYGIHDDTFTNLTQLEIQDKVYRFISSYFDVHDTTTLLDMLANLDSYDLTVTSVTYKRLRARLFKFNKSVAYTIRKIMRDAIHSSVKMFIETVTHNHDFIDRIEVYYRKHPSSTSDDILLDIVGSAFYNNNNMDDIIYRKNSRLVCSCLEDDIFMKCAQLFTISNPRDLINRCLMLLIDMLYYRNSIDRVNNSFSSSRLTVNDYIHCILGRLPVVTVHTKDNQCYLCILTNNCTANNIGIITESSKDDDVIYDVWYIDKTTKLYAHDILRLFSMLGMNGLFYFSNTTNGGRADINFNELDSKIQPKINEVVIRAISNSTDLFTDDDIYYASLLTSNNNGYDGEIFYNHKYLNDFISYLMPRIGNDAADIKKVEDTLNELKVPFRSSSFDTVSSEMYLRFSNITVKEVKIAMNDMYYLNRDNIKANITVSFTVSFVDSNGIDYSNLGYQFPMVLAFNIVATRGKKDVDCESDLIYSIDDVDTLALSRFSNINTVINGIIGAQDLRKSICNSIVDSDIGANIVLANALISGPISTTMRMVDILFARITEEYYNTIDKLLVTPIQFNGSFVDLFTEIGYYYKFDDIPIYKTIYSYDVNSNTLDIAKDVFVDTTTLIEE